MDPCNECVEGEAMRKRMSSALACTLAAVGIAAGLAGGGLSSGASTAAESSTNWTVYHGDAGGTGASRGLRALNTARRAWTPPVLNGELYGVPLVADGRG